MTLALMAVRQEVNNFESSVVVQELEFAMSLAICSHCILSICNIYLFPALVLRAGFAF